MPAGPGTAPRKMRFLPLVAATFFMVSGGPYAIEDILGGAGFGWAILILLMLPFIWSLPTALMIGELASAIPAEGGFYVWVRRAMGPFWGYQEGWLSLAASIFDMAIYPAFFVSYLGKFNPALTDGWHGMAWKLAVVVLCCLWNLRGAPAIGEDSVWMSALLLAPFAVFVGLGVWRGIAQHPAVHWSGPASEQRAFDGNPGGHVELHGLGQRLHGRAGSGESAAHLSARDDCGHHRRCGDVYAAVAGHGGGGTFGGAAFRPATGSAQRARWAGRC